MRKQYHFRPGASGLDAWDVDSLVAKGGSRAGGGSNNDPGQEAVAYAPAGLRGLPTG